MRNLLLSAAAALMAVALPGVAAAQSGYVGAYYTNAEIDTGADNDVDAYGLDGVVAFDAGALGVQLGANYGTLDGDGDEVDAYGVDGHLFTRNAQWQLGGGVAVEKLDGDGSEIDEWTVAAEGLYFLDRATVGAALSYGESDLGGGGGDLETVALDGEFRYFVSDNFRIDANAGFGNAEADVGGDADFWGAGVGAEYQLSSVPVSLVANYDHVNVDDSGFEADAFTVGARWNFGGTTLLERDRSGANLSKPRGLFGRLFGS
ncbi:MAG: hypothetical protein WDM79_15685 [Terricaulis sp.]